MKLTEEIKRKIDGFFAEINDEDLLRLMSEKYHVEVVDVDLDSVDDAMTFD